MPWRRCSCPRSSSQTSRLRHAQCPLATLSLFQATRLFGTADREWALQAHIFVISQNTIPEHESAHQSVLLSRTRLHVGIARAAQTAAAHVREHNYATLICVRLTVLSSNTSCSRRFGELVPAFPITSARIASWPTVLTFTGDTLASANGAARAGGVSDTVPQGRWGRHVVWAAQLSSCAFRACLLSSKL